MPRFTVVDTIGVTEDQEPGEVLRTVTRPSAQGFRYLVDGREVAAVDIIPIAQAALAALRG